MPDLLWYWAWTGVLGLTCQMCVIADVLSALTLHIYCFYVYAARSVVVLVIVLLLNMNILYVECFTSYAKSRLILFIVFILQLPCMLRN